uniref:Large ribosomal subunit protein uL29c n=1 Tax=Digenea simplex TaxID=945030 RepID=A0A1Z1MUT3_DIGSM|nr:ribosomal protein L29 [Digenea simplex]ARW69582.1 ribosomal protein L29 [Digenea simplex]
MKEKNNINLMYKLERVDQDIIDLKKELVLLRIKKVTKQKLEPHIIKKTKHQVAQMLTIHKSKK